MTSFSDISGQERIKKQLKDAVKYDKISHAYIFCGDKGSGKKLTARTFAATIQCEKGGTEPCGECHSCRMAATDNHPDIITVRHEKPNSISVGEIREQLVSDVGIKPYSGKKKIYIVPDAEKMTSEAQNAILKTIEEPPEYAVIMLLTQNREQLLPTILSRCAVISMKPVSDEVVEKYLETELDIAEERARTYAAFAHGNIGQAMEMASSEKYSEMMDFTLECMKKIRDMGAADIAASVKSMTDYKDSISDILDIMLLWFRDILVCKGGCGAGLTFTNEKGYIERESERCGYEGLENIINSISAARAEYKASVSFEPVTELLLIKIHDNI